MPTIETKIPYLVDLGKNKIKGFRRGGGYYVRKEHKEACNGLIYAIQAGNKGQLWKKEKVRVDIFLQKPQSRCDVANMVDGVYDAVKIAIGVDDMYFWGLLDYEYEKGIEPFLLITISQ